jgi:DNA-binding IclR family transcriptional regulator
MKDPTDYNVRAVERALNILACFDNDHPERGISEIALVANLHKATAYRIVTTLVNHGYLEWQEDVQKYRLGKELASLGFKVIQRMDLRREALPFMKDLVEFWDETCDLSVFDQGKVFYIEILRGNHALTISAAIGQRLPAYCTASGKLFLSHLPESELDAILEQPLSKKTENTVVDINELKKQFEMIRKNGYAVDYEEFELGVCAIAAPIYNRQGKIVAAIGSPSPISRMTPERISDIAAAFKKAAIAISQRMGYGQ